MFAMVLAGLLSNTLQNGAVVKSVKVHFEMRSPELPDSTTVYITGSIEQLGNWSPNKVKMTARGHHVWEKDISVPDGVSIEYKYTLGSWDYQPAHPTGAPLENFAILSQPDTGTTDQVVYWTKPGKRLPIAHSITGNVRYHLKLKGVGLQERDVIVWLPPGYDKNQNRRYPVLYMHDGQNVFDAATSAFGREWQADETADRLIRARRIPPLIIVGMNCTSDRTAEYSPGPKGEAYMNFVIHNVKPFIDQTYRTNPDRHHTFIAGSSMGGLISLMFAWEHSDVFSGAICMSPAFVDPANRPAWDYAKIVANSTKHPQPIFLYIDIGDIGLDHQLRGGVDATIDALKKQGFVEDKDYAYINDWNGRHNEDAWARRLPHALEYLFNRPK